MQRFLVLASAFLLFSACDSDTDPTPDAGTTPPAADSGQPDAAATGMDAGFNMDAMGRPDTGPVDDMNDDFSEAVALVNGRARGVINPAEDKDYFSFSGTAGQYMSIITARGAASELDPVLRLYDGNMTLVSTNDDALPRSAVDSELIYRIPADGTYFIEILEFSDWRAGETPEGGRSYTYEIRTAPLMAAGNPFVTTDTETGSTAASAVDLTFFQGTQGVVLGTFKDGTDTDVFRLTVTEALSLFSAVVMPMGPEGYGSTTNAGLLWITDTAGSTIAARIDNSDGTIGNLQPPLTAGQYLLWVQHPQAALGANDFYVIKTRFGTENPPEINVDTNDTAAGAGVLTFAGDPGQVFTLSRLPGNDVDYYRFGLPAGLNFAVTCGGRVAGSGVRDLRVELRDESDTVVAMATETATGAASIPNMTLTSTNAYIRLSKGSQDPEVNGAWVRCGLRSSQ